MRVCVVFGTRPEAIKMAPVVKALSADPRIDLHVCVTAQHRDMLDQVLEFFEIVPDTDLDIMKSGQTLFGVTTRVLEGLEGVLTRTSPDLVLVHGDTTTAMAAALAAFYLHIPVGHVEAGLRSGDLDRPWPEEMNRRVIDSMSRYLFAPTQSSKDNLLRESIDPAQISVTGNTVIDALLYVIERMRSSSEILEKISAPFRQLNPNKRLILVTGHRRESFGSGMEGMCKGLLKLSERDDVEILYPVHMNQNVREPVNRLLAGRENIYLTEPQDYLGFVYLMDRSHLVITDSGGIQEEAPALGKPVLVTRDVTERQEAVDAGTARLVGTDTDRIVAAATNLLDDDTSYEAMSQAHNPFGDGNACARILESICSAQYH